MAATEIKEQPRQLDYTREGFYRGRRIFGCLTGTAWTDGLAFIGTDFPGAPSGVEPPKGCRASDSPSA